MTSGVTNNPRNRSKRASLRRAACVGCHPRAMWRASLGRGWRYPPKYSASSTKEQGGPPGWHGGPGQQEQLPAMGTGSRHIRPDCCRWQWASAARYSVEVTQGGTSSSGGGFSEMFGTDTFRVAPDVDSTIRVLEGEQL